MLKLIKCEFLKLKRKPLVFISLLLSVFMPLAYAVFLADVNTDVDATMYDELELDKLGDRKTALFLIMSDTDSTFNFLISISSVP